MMQWLHLLHQRMPWLSPRRTVAAAVVAAMLATVAGIGQWPSEPQVPLFEGRQFRESELVALQAAFASHQLDDWECEQRRLLAPRSRRNEYLRAAEQAGALPQQLHHSAPLTASLLDTREVREEKRRRGLQAELVKLVQALKGVEDATVRYSEDTIRGLHRRTDRRVLVAVRCVDDEPVSGMQIQAIQSTIVASVAGLRPEDVTVTDLNHATAWHGLSQVQMQANAPRKQPNASGLEKTAAERLERTAAERLERTAAERLERTAAERLERTAAERLERTAAERLERTAAERLERTAAERLERTAAERLPAPARAKQLGSQQLAQQWASQVRESLRQLPGVKVDVALPNLPGPSAHPAVHVRGDRSLAVKVSIPVATLRKHFGSSTPTDSLPQVAAEQLQPVVERTLGRPAAVLVAMTPASHNAIDAAPASSNDRQAPSQPPQASRESVRGSLAPDSPSDSTIGWIISAVTLIAFGWLLQRVSHRPWGEEPTEAVSMPAAPRSPPAVVDRMDRASDGEAVDRLLDIGEDYIEDRVESGAPTEEQPALETDHRLWVETLERERPQVIAAVLSQMPPPDAALILDGMCDDLGSDVLRRIGEMGDVDDDVRETMCAALAVSLESRRRVHQRRAAGEAAVEAILSARNAASTAVESSSMSLSGDPQMDAFLEATAETNAGYYDEDPHACLPGCESHAPTVSFSAADGERPSRFDGGIDLGAQGV